MTHDYIAPPNVFCIAGPDGKPIAPDRGASARCGRHPGDHDLLMASKADARVVIAARKLVAWIDGGSQVGPWPHASSLVELREALAAHPAGHAYVSAWLPCAHCSSMIRWANGQYEDSLGETTGHSPRPPFDA